MDGFCNQLQNLIIPKWDNLNNILIWDISTEGRSIQMANRPWDHKREALTKLLQTLRIEAGLTQTEMANLLGRPQSYVSKYESGERKLDFVEVLEVCEILEITPQVFVTRYVAAV